MQHEKTIENKQDLLDRQIDLLDRRDDLIEQANRWFDDSLQELYQKAVEGGILEDGERAPWHIVPPGEKHQWQIDGLSHKYRLLFEKDD